MFTLSWRSIALSVAIGLCVVGGYSAGAYELSGFLDTTFGNGTGFVEEDLSAGADEVHGMWVDGNDLFVGGYDNAAGDHEWRLEKRNARTGALKTKFSGDGVITVNPSGASEKLYGIVTNDNNVFLAGRTQDSGSNLWRIEKRNRDTGALRPGFDGDGIITLDFSAGSDVPRAVLLDNTGLYVGGFDSVPGDTEWRLEKRDPGSGAVITAFSGDGVITVDPSGSDDQIRALARYDGAIYVAGWDSAPGDQQWRIEKRDKDTGALDGAFDGDGILTVNPSAGNDRAYGIAANDTGVYIAGVEDYGAGDLWRIEKRDPVTGVLVPAFSVDGVVTVNIAGAGIQLEAMVMDETGLYVGGFETLSGWGVVYHVRRYLLANGALDPGFADGGVYLSSQGDGVNALAIDRTGLYLSGFAPIGGSIGWRIEKLTIPQDSDVAHVVINEERGGGCVAAPSEDAASLPLVVFALSLAARRVGRPRYT